MKLNLGCSKYPMSGWVNVDCRNLPNVDVVCDLETFPWPFAAASVDEIFAGHVYEHLADPLAAVYEAHRVLKPGGRLHLRVPNANGIYAHAYAHKSYFSRMWFSDLEGCDQAQNDTGRLFVNTWVRLHVFDWHFQPKWFLRPLVALIEVLGNFNAKLQLAWEISGVIVPTEIEWSGEKRNL